MAKDNEKPQFMGREILDYCPCGAKVKFYERQEIVLDKREDVWMRMCATCIEKDCVFLDEAQMDAKNRKKGFDILSK